MKIYLMRHGAAAPPGSGLGDAHRYLTRAGRQTCRAVGRALREAGIEFDAIVSSPLLRAAQTAELLADAVDYLGEIPSHAAFTPGAHPKVAVEEIAARGTAVAVVGHEPYLSDLAAFIVGRPGFAPFRQAQMSLFDDRKSVWMLHPEALQFQDLHTA